MACKVGLKLKTMVASGSTDQDAIQKLSGAVLGYNWDPTKDVMGVAFKFNVSRKQKGVWEKPNLTLAEIDTFKAMPHNRRSLLGICNSVYDPLGIASPYTIRLKILMEETLDVNNLGDWNSAVSCHLIDESKLSPKE